MVANFKSGAVANEGMNTPMLAIKFIVLVARRILSMGVAFND
jgi:hypothetical protein